MISIHEKLQAVLSRIREYEIKYQRPSHSVSLLAVSKSQASEKIQQAFAAGQLSFGENYLQEALSKMELLTEPAVQWHFIGSIQSNKTRLIAENFSWVHTVCSQKIAQRLNDQRLEHLPPLNVCLEVNLSGEGTKSGVTDREELFELTKFCQSLPRLKLRGLMTIPSLEKDFKKQREAFRQLRELKDVSMDTLSMGMTDDMEAAIAEGATIVRVGRGIFGER